MRPTWHLRRLLSGEHPGARRALGLLILAAVVIGIAGLQLVVRAQDAGKAAPPEHSGPRDYDAVELSDTQREMISVATATTREFPREREAVGNIDFNEDMSVQVSTPYQGRIVQIKAKIGDVVTKGQVLFTIESPDLIQAESSLIAAAGVLELTSRALERAQQLCRGERPAAGQFRSTDRGRGA
jgi:cobalt-zinc-cadmium efflux system membrane fusion protein